MKTLNPYIRMGMIPTIYCDYYLVRSYYSIVGQHYSWSESSAITWANAILGASANTDGYFLTAYLGKVSECDMCYDLFRWAVSEVVRVDGSYYCEHR